MEIKDIEAKTSSTFCILPWVHLSTRPDGLMRTCCTANASSVGPINDKEHGGQVGIIKTEDGKPNNLNVSGFVEAWNSTYMRNARLKMLNGEKPASCIKCYNEEDAGHRSKRQWESEYWTNQGRSDLDKLIADTKPDGSVPPKLTYIDLRMGTKCQLSCIICSPHDSSSWIPDWKKLNPQIQNESLKQNMQWDNKGSYNGSSYNWHKNNPRFWAELYEQIPHMQQLYFAGGESTVIEEHYTLLEKVVEMGYAHQIELRYNSNGIEMPDRLFQLWDKFKRVRFHYSVDSIGPMNDYIRFGSQWEHTVKQFHLLDNTGPNVEITVACAVNALNIMYIPEFVQWKLEQGFKKINDWPLGAGLINWHMVYHPAHLNTRVLPAEMKDAIEAKFEKWIAEWLVPNWTLATKGRNDVSFVDFENASYGIKRMRGLVNFMKTGDWSRRLPEFKEYIELMDGIRDTNFRDTFPEMAYLLDEQIQDIPNN